jgi:AcrR family transcriptional regulator
MARPANPELRVEILKAATAIIEECGPDCVTMREVAEKVGYSPTTIYLYFKDKSEVLKETVRMASDDLADAIDAASVGPTPLDELRQRGRAYLVWGVMHPGLYQLMYQQPGDIQWTDADLEQSTRGGAETQEAIRRAIEAGQIGPIADIEMFHMAVFAALHGATSLAISRRLAPGALRMSAPSLVDVASGVAEYVLGAVLAQYPALGAR